MSHISVLLLALTTLFLLISELSKIVDEDREMVLIKKVRNLLPDWLVAANPIVSAMSFGVGITCSMMFFLSLMWT